MREAATGAQAIGKCRTPKRGRLTPICQKV